MADILAESDSDDSKCDFKVNEDYAAKYETFRGKEELQKFTDRYGEEGLAKLENWDSDASSSSTDEDENADKWTPDVEKQFFKTLSCLKQKNPKIYDSQISFFDVKQENAGVEAKKTKKHKPMFLKDYERKVILEHGGVVKEEDEVTMRADSPTFVEEQKQIRQSFKAALKDEDDEDGIAGMFKPRTKSKEEQQREEDEYREWLKGQKDELGEDTSELQHLKNYWTDPNLDKGEAYLRDYILNKRYLERQDKDYIPSYDEIVHDSDEGGLSGDEQTCSQMEEFEHKYNFRFEEPDQEFIKRYPRCMGSSMRPKDARRKTHREEVRERKMAEKEAKRQQLMQLKAVKRKEIEERLEKLRRITGNDDIEFHDEDLRDDFDPEKHDAKMQQLFDSQFYAEPEGEKPVFPDLDEELEIENWDEYEGGEGGDEHNPHFEDPDFNMDCDYNPKAELQRQLVAASGKRKKNRRRSKLAQLLAQRKPQFEPNEQEVEKYMDEYYKMDCEDIIGDLPCRFKYRKVIANNFGLTTEEILMADDKELNKWCSLKKTCQYRSEDKEHYDLKAYKSKAQMEALKRKILPSLYKHEEETNEEETPKKKKKKKKKNKLKKEESDSPQKVQSSSNDSVKDNPRNNKLFDNGEDSDIEILMDTKHTGVKNLSPKKINKSMDLSTENQLKSDSKNKKINGNNSEESKTEIPNKKIKQGKISPSKTDEKICNQDSQVQKKQNKLKKWKNLQTDSVVKRQENAKPDKKFINGKVTKQGNASKQNVVISDSRLKAYGINPKKYKNKMKYGRH